VKVLENFAYTHKPTLLGSSTKHTILFSISFCDSHKIYRILKGKGKAIPLQAWGGAEGSRKLRFPDCLTRAQDGGKVVSLTHRPHLLPANTPGTHYRLSPPQGHSEIRRIYVNEKFHDTI
jgi:hypothetical protein